VGHYIHPSFKKPHPEVRMKRYNKFESIPNQRVITIKFDKPESDITSHQESPTDLCPPIHPDLLLFPPYPSSAALSVATTILTTDKTDMVEALTTST